MRCRRDVAELKLFFNEHAALRFWTQLAQAEEAAVADDEPPEEASS